MDDFKFKFKNIVLTIMDDFKFKFKNIVLTSKNTNMSVSFLYSLTTVRDFSFQSSVTNSDIFSQ